MTLGIYFDGTSIKYLICAKSGAGDCRIVAQAESLEAANRELKLISSISLPSTCISRA